MLVLSAMIRRIAIACLVVVVQVAQASAQAPATPRGPGSAATNCAPTTASPNGDGVATTGKANEQLGDKLAKSDGVLCPPAGVDPEIRAPAPDAGTAKTPVIPPPGSPGGDPSVRPK